MILEISRSASPESTVESSGIISPGLTLIRVPTSISSIGVAIVVSPSS